MKKKIYFLFLFLGCYAVQAQRVKVSGVVSDTLGLPLELANIIVTQKADSSVVDFAISNREGYYRIGLSAGKKYIFTASFLGMTPVQKEVFIPEGSQDVRFDFQLKTKPNQLKGVAIVYEIPVVVIGDTIVYNTDSFTNGTEENLGDALEKLPGFEVSDEGDVKVEGKKVSKLMVGGKDFFGGNTRLGTKNIPANAIDKVEVLRNYNEVQQLDGVADNRETVALNIKLKEGKKKFWFGNVETGAGIGNRNPYLGSLRLFYYTPASSLNLIGNTNNIGDVPFTFMDYFNFVGGFRAFGNGSSLPLDNGLSSILVQSKRVHTSENDFGAANFTTSLSDTWDMGAFVIYSANQTSFVNQNEQNYVQQQLRTVREGRRDLKNRLGLFKFKTAFSPHQNFQLKYDVLVKNSAFDRWGKSTTILYDDGMQSEQPIAEKNTDSPFSVRQNLATFFTWKEDNIFASYFQHTYQESNPFYNVRVKNQPFPEILPLVTPQNPYDLSQYKGLTTSKWDGKLDYYRVLNAKSHLNISVGYTRSQQKLNFKIFQNLENGGTNLIKTTNFSNDLTYDFSDAYLGVKYKLLTGIFTLTPGITWHNYHRKVFQNSRQTLRDKNLILPEFSAVAEFNSSETLQLDYHLKADFAEAKNLTEDYVLNSYNQLSRGNPALENSLSHQLSLRYGLFNMFNFTNMNYHIRYSRKIDGWKQNYSLEKSSQVGQFVNSDFPAEDFAFGGSFQKTFRKFRAHVKADISIGNYTSLVNEEERKINTFKQSYTFSLETNFDDFPNVEFGYEQNIDRYINADLKTVYYAGYLFVETDIRFLKNFNFSGNYSHYNYADKAETIRNTYAFLHAELTYETPNNHWEFSLKGTNLLDVKAIYREGVRPSYNYQTTYFVQPRTALFSVRYKL